MDSQSEMNKSFKYMAILLSHLSLIFIVTIFLLTSNITIHSYLLYTFGIVQGILYCALLKKVLY